MALVAWYKMDDMNDSSGNNNHLSYIYNNGLIVPNASGKINSCYERTALNVGSDHLLSANNVDLRGSFTMCCWAYVMQCHSDNNANGLVTNHNHATNQGAGITVKEISSTDFRISCNTGTGTSRTYNSYYGTSNIKDRWAHLTVRFDKPTNHLSLWVDGIMEYEITYAMSAVPDKIGVFSWSLGYNSTAAYRPKCKIDDVRIYNHAMSQKEIYELSKAKILHYKFDDFQEPTENLSPNLSTFAFSHYLNRTSHSFIVLKSPVKENDNVLEITSSSDLDTAYSFTSGYINIEANATYTFSFYSKTNGLNQLWNKSPGTQGYTSISWYDSTDTLIIETRPSSNQPLNSSWNRFILTGTAPSNAVKAKIRLGNDVPNLSNQTSVWITGVQFEKKDHATPFVSGSRGGKVRDCSGYNNHAVLDSTTPQWTEDSKIGNGAYDFNGSNQCIYFPKTSLVDGTKEFSVSFFMKAHSLPTTSPTVLSFFNENYIMFTFGDSKAANVLGLRCCINGVWDTPTYTGVIELNRYYHVCGTYSPVSGFNLYLDGVKVSTSSVTGPIIEIAQTNQIGSISTSTTRFFDGCVDDIRIYATTLSDSDVKELYQTRACLDDKGNVYAQSISEPRNFLNPDLFFKYSNQVQNPGYEMYDGHFAWRVYPHWFYPNQALKGEFKENTRYKIHLVLSHNTFYDVDGTYKTGGLVVVYTDGTTEDLIYQANATVEWRTFDIITAANKTVNSIAVHYWTSKIVYIDTESYMIEYKDNGVDENGTFIARTYSETGPVDGLMAWYKLDGNTKDCSGNNIHATKYGGLVDTVGVNSLAYQFNGTDSYIKATCPAVGDNKPWTMSCWIKTSTIPTWNPGIMSMGYMPVITMLSDGKVRCWWANGTGYTGMQSTTNCADGAFHLITATYDGTTGYIYVDGNLEGTRTDVNLSRYNDLFLGTEHNNGHKIFNGIIDDARFYNRALSADEVGILYNLNAGNTCVQQSENGIIYIKGQVKEV